MPVVRNVHVQSVTATAAPRVMYVVAFPGAIIDDGQRARPGRSRRFL
jgi:hypothetical protein